MAKQRYINTQFWSDPFIRRLKPEEKYIYIYFLTNSHTEICGSYEISMDIISFETGYPMDTVSKCIDTLSKAGKILYLDDWIFIKNFQKHQGSSPKIKEGIKLSFSKVPPEIAHQIEEFNRLGIGYTYPMDRGSYSNTNTNSNINSSNEELQPEAEVVSGVVEIPEIKEKKPAYGNPGINQMLAVLKTSAGVDDFKEPQKTQRQYANHLLKLMERIGEQGFRGRLAEILADNFKQKNCNSIAYIYREIKSYIHSPPPTKEKSSLVIV